MTRIKWKTQDMQRTTAMRMTFAKQAMKKSLLPWIASSLVRSRERIGVREYEGVRRIRVFVPFLEEPKVAERRRFKLKPRKADNV
jgi:hypothetical protein